MDNLMEYAFNRYMSELLLHLLSRYDENAKKELLRRKLEHWLKQVNRQKDYEQSMADKIQTEWKKYRKERKRLDEMKLNSALDKLHKRRFMDNLMEYAFNRYMSELLLHCQIIKIT